MSKGKNTVKLVIALVCYSLLIAGVFCFIGYKIAYRQMEKSTSILNSQTFYATVTDIQDNKLTVKGMEINDINFRGEFCFSVVEKTKIVWRGTSISIEELNVGDNISITFIGGVLETEPGQIEQVEVIQLLDDEK